LRAAPARHLLDHFGPRTPMYVVAAGKAAWRMAVAFSDLGAGRVKRGVVAGSRPDGAALESTYEWFEAGHPDPNHASISAAQRALALAREAKRDPDALLVVLLSGGASAMLAAPAAEVTLEDKIATSRAIMHAGFAIDALNCVRKHLSDVKGGQLAAAAARTLTLAISDVHGPIADDPSVIGSGPTVPDPTTYGEAMEIVRSIREIPARVRARLDRGLKGELPETIKPGDARLANAKYEVIANRVTSLDAARIAAESLGYTVTVIDRATGGEARDASRQFVDRARVLARSARRPHCVLAAGETTVTVAGKGLGGRNQEFALAAAPHVEALRASLAIDVVLASAGTDGADGPTDAAGAVVDSTTLERARARGLDGLSTLAANDSYHFFEPLGDLIKWGPTGTNVGDVQLLLMA
jgi:glycerate-2-kinase